MNHHPLTYSHHILIFGAGRSATVLISHLIAKSEKNNWLITVVDADIQLARSKVKNSPNAKILSFNINNNEERKKAIQSAHIIISMLPPHLHHLVAYDCVACKKNLLTASYLDEKLKALENDIQQNGLLFLCEMGLDPGIDHMSAMQLIHNIHAKSGTIKSFKSHCGGLIAPESDDNPWHYKITWNPANVVNAGKTGASFKQNRNFKTVDYPNIFKNCGNVSVPGLGQYAFYPNRDSASYATLYGMEQADTFIRTTLRHPDFCKGWYYIAKAGLTDSSILPDFNNKRFVDWLNDSLRRFSGTNNLSDFIAQNIKPADQEQIKHLCSYLGIDDEIIIPKSVSSSSATILQYLLETKLNLNEQDKDMIVMLHEIEYEWNSAKHSVKSCMIVKGDDKQNTAMAKTVGLPLAIATELILNHTIAVKGLHIPVLKAIYEPVLAKLKENKIGFQETMSLT